MNRKLAAILAADVQGYSRMMGQDEAATVEALHALRAEVFGPVLADTRGSVVKSMGDGWLVEFASAVDAVNAAMQVQDRLRGHPKITLRMGVHIGDITRNEHDIYGDGINVAARLEGQAPSGGILISDAVYSGLDGTLSPSFAAAGELNLKNIARPVKAWVRAPDSANRAAAASPQPEKRTLPHLLIQPTANSDTRAELQDLADALTADLHSYFGGVNWLSASISNAESTGAYALRPVLRARGNRLRLDTRLLDPDGTVIFSSKSDSTLDDAFDWQDNVVADTANNGIAILLQTETARLSAIPQEQLSAEQNILMGIMAWRTFDAASYVRSVTFHDRAIQINPGLADAYAEAIIVVLAGRSMSHISGLQPFAAKVPAWIEAARPLAAGHAMLTLGIAIATFAKDQRPAAIKDAIGQALRLAPFDARILGYCGWANLWSGHTRDALECFEKSMEFNRFGPFHVASLGGAATACVQLGQDEKCITYADRGLTLADEYPTYYAAKAAALAHLGRLEDARVTMAHYAKIEPKRTLKRWQATNNYGNSPGAKRYFEGLAMAGLPTG